MLVPLLVVAVLVQDRVMLPAPDDDRTHASAEGACESSPDTITVCGKQDMARFRAAPLDGARFRPKPLRPEFKLPGGGQVAVHAEQRSLPGAGAPAAMVTLKIPLGRKKPGK